MKKLHEAVRERESNICQSCGKYFEDNACCAHHLLSQGAYPHLRYNPDVCVLVCAFCHEKAHKGLIPKFNELKDQIKEKIDLQ